MYKPAEKGNMSKVTSLMELNEWVQEVTHFVEVSVEQIVWNSPKRFRLYN